MGDVSGYILTSKYIQQVYFDWSHLLGHDFLTHIFLGFKVKKKCPEIAQNIFLPALLCAKAAVRQSEINSTFQLILKQTTKVLFMKAQTN